MSQQLKLHTVDPADHDREQEQIDTDEKFLVDPTSLYRDEAQYILAIAKLVLTQAENTRKTIEKFQLDCSKFVVMYRDTGNWHAQFVVNGMVAQYIAIYENLANSLSLVLCPGPFELPQLYEWLSSQRILTEQHKLRNLCAHNANVKPPLRGSTFEWSVFKPDEFFEFVEKQIPLLIEELPELIADLEENMHRYGTPVSTPPDNSYTMNESYAQQLLDDSNNDSLFNNFQYWMINASRASEAMGVLAKRVESGEMNLTQQYAYDLSTKSRGLEEQFLTGSSAIREKRNKRAAEIMVLPFEQRLSASQNPVFEWEVSGQESSNLDWGVDSNAAPWDSDGWVPDDMDDNIHPGAASCASNNGVPTI